MSRNDLRYERYEPPSRWSRVVVMLCALAVGVLAVWVLTPIVLANLMASRAAVAAPPVVADRPREAKDLTIPVQPAEDVASDVVSIVRDAPDPPTTAPAFAAPSAAPSGGALSSASQSPAALASAIPWPAPASQSPGVIEPEASSPPADFGPVPMPRKRPNATLAAHLGIPLPRPRPDAAAAEVPPPVEDGMDALIERTSKIE
jgi:hypothetical protein